METIQETTANEPSKFSIKLETIMQDFVSEINHCQEQSNLWQERKRQLQSKMTETLQQIQKQCNVVPTFARKELTVPQLIREFLEKNGPARPREIRKFLLGLGRNTNPGVALGRLVAEGAIKNTERGVYTLP
jgi:hypothetical protein